VRNTGNVFASLRTRRFWPLCVTQACGALNDNLVRNALVVLALFRAGSAGPVVVALASGLFIFPYILLSATAGQLADCYDKAWFIRVVKLAELGLLVGAGAGFLLDSLPILLMVLVALGVQASLFGPLKYGILPDHLQPEELLAGNGVVEATTFVAILNWHDRRWLVSSPTSRIRGVRSAQAAGIRAQRREGRHYDGDWERAVSAVILGGGWAGSSSRSLPSSSFSSGSGSV
jgi:hypothetical protein